MDGRTDRITRELITVSFLSTFPLIVDDFCISSHNILRVDCINPT